MASSSKKTRYVSLAAGLGVATTKFVVAGVTGSSVMFSEGIYSLVYTGNERLLLGLTRSQQCIIPTPMAWPRCSSGCC